MTPKPLNDIKSTVHRYVKDRLEKQPIRGKTFGSIFKNPAQTHAAKLIESAGLKGYKQNNISIYPINMQTL